MERVTVGRMVHYRATEFDLACKAAIVTSVANSDTGLANLAVFPDDPRLLDVVRRYAVPLMTTDLKGAGPTWHWPERGE